jgi:polysaccharide biosynthesis protein PslG
VAGARDRSRLDSVVEELRDDGIEPLLTILGSPSWANGVSATTPDHYLYVPPRGPELDAWLDRYADFVAAAVERYKRYVRRWEIWNEPNLAHFWRPRPDPLAYREVYEVLRATILRVDPGAEVAVGGVTDLTTASAPDIRGLDFLRLLTRTRAPLDNVAIHTYPTGGHPPNVHIPGENNFDDIEVVRDQLAAEGERPSIWVTEWGWSSTAVGEAAQAQYVDESLTMLETRFSFVRVATYFADYDRPPEFFQGLLDADLDPKPAAAAFLRHADLAASRCTMPAG